LTPTELADELHRTLFETSLRSLTKGQRSQASAA
jgi:hypothetical protein